MKRIEINIEKLKSLYESGLSCQQVANSLGICKITVIRRFKEIGYKTREPNYKHGLMRRSLPEAERSRNRRKLNPEKVRARELLSYHVKKGNIKKPNYCSSCGIQKEIKCIEAHHKDYSKPLEVIWLCRACHKEIHKLIT